MTIEEIITRIETTLEQRREHTSEAAGGRNATT